MNRHTFVRSEITLRTLSGKSPNQPLSANTGSNPPAGSKMLMQGANWVPITCALASRFKYFMLDRAHPYRYQRQEHAEPKVVCQLFSDICQPPPINAPVSRTSSSAWWYSARKGENLLLKSVYLICKAHNLQTSGLKTENRIFPERCWYFPPVKLLILKYLMSRVPNEEIPCWSTVGQSLNWM